MSTDIDWIAASETTVELYAPGEDWVGAADQFDHQHALTLSSGDGVIAIEGTLPELRDFAMHVLAALTKRAGDGRSAS